MQQKPNVFALILLSGLLFYACQYCDPLFKYGQIQWLTALVYGLLGIVLIQLSIFMLGALASLAEWLDAQKVKGKNGTAHFATYKAIKHELSKNKFSPFWGRFADKTKKVILAGYVSSVLTIAPAGSGKGIYTVVNMIMAIHESKLVPDFKGELVCMLKKALEKRGERVYVLNAGGLFEDLLGQSDCYNPLDIITNSLYSTGGLRDISSDLKEFSSQLLPEPAGKSSENSYFRSGSRNLIGMAILIQCMIDTYAANLSDVANLIENRQEFEYHLRWIVGVDLEGKALDGGAMPIEMTDWAAKHSENDLNSIIHHIRGRSQNILKMMSTKDNRTFESFISGAQQALSGFAFGRITSIIGHSTFSMDELKEEGKPTTIFIVADASRIEAYKPYLGLVQWCAFTAIKRHKNKHVPVYAIMDEATNYVIEGLASLMTWARGYGLRLHLIFQDFSAFIRVYGEEALQTLLSETEIKQFLPGQRSPKTLELIEKLLGQQSVISHSYADNNDKCGKSQSSSEAARPLMTADEIRRSKHGLLFIRNCPPVQFEPISYAEISPWRKQVGINPFHKKAFLKRVKVKMKG